MTDRVVLSITGTDRIAFLQGLITNDVAKPGLIYSALLSPQGKYLADFFVLARESDILIDVAWGLAPDLTKRLAMYRLRADVQIDQTDTSVTRGTNAPPNRAHTDPRHPALGWRSYDGAEADDTDWDALRVTHLIPESGIELIPNETYILEAGFEPLNGVDFRKGCYVGQEVTARMKHKTDLRKGLAKVDISGSAPIGSDITKDGKTVGQIFTQSGGHAIAYLRFDRAGSDMKAGDATVNFSP